MDSMNLIINGKIEAVNYKNITDIKNGKARTIVGRWYEIDCDCLKRNDYETVDADKDTNIPESYIVCNHCNRVTYTKDLKPS